MRRKLLLIVLVKCLLFFACENHACRIVLAIRSYLEQKCLEGQIEELLRRFDFLHMVVSNRNMSVQVKEQLLLLILVMIYIYMYDTGS